MLDEVYSNKWYKMVKTIAKILSARMCLDYSRLFYIIILYYILYIILFYYTTLFSLDYSRYGMLEGGEKIQFYFYPLMLDIHKKVTHNT